MSRPSRARITALVVAAGDGPYLSATLEALAAQTRAPDRVVLVGRPGTATREAAQAVPIDIDVVEHDGAAGLSEAVTAVIGSAQIDTDWLWLLHDDSAPAPGALGALAEVVQTGRSIAIAGCKQVGWHHPDRLVSVGVQYTRDIQRFTGIEDGEVDQGQHDDREDIDAVGTAGMLIDREVFTALGGPDPALGPFGDGRDLSRRARLAGHRVVVVPGAVVRHARASYLGLRDDPDREPDPDHSFRQRRVAILHSRFTEAPAALVPFVVLAALLSGPIRAIGRLISTELDLVGQELWAPLAALGGWGSVRRARRRAKTTRTGSRRRLRPLQARWRDVARVRRDRRLQAAAQRRTSRAPSELEMRERAALGRRRRLVLAGVLVLTAAIAGITMAARVFGGPVLGGALLPVDGAFSDLWAAVTSPWLTTGDGWSVPADPFLGVLAVLSAVTGGPLGTPVWVTLAITLVLAIPLSALTAWFAAGAATRSLSTRAWAALVWAFAPPLLLALTDGRLGPVVAHVLLPLVVLGLARAFGLDRRDVVVSGLVGARRVEPATGSKALDARARRERLAAIVAAETGEIALTQTDEQPVTDPGDEEAVTDPDDDEETLEPIPSNTAEPYAEDEEEQASIITRPSGVGSVGAAAAAGLCFAGVAAGAPVLLPAGLVCLLVLALVLPRRGVPGRSRLLLTALPAVVLFGPLLTHALQVPDGWRLLLSTPGAMAPAPEPVPVLALLGWPHEPPAAGLAAFSPVLMLVASGTVLVAALVALARGAGLARGIRLGWVMAAIGAAAAVAAPQVEVGISRLGDGTDVSVTGWAGAGVTLLLAGLLTATVTASSGLRAALGGQTFGWRQLGAAFVSVLLVGGVAVSVVGWTSILSAGTPAFTLRQNDPVPALGDELQASGSRSRVLALWASAAVVDARLWRSEGPQLTETSTALALTEVDRTELDPADEALRTIVAALATGNATNAAQALADHAVGVVVVPRLDSSIARSEDDVARSRLITMLDSVAGLDRVTENESGVVWRVSADGVSTARVVWQGSDGVQTPIDAGPVGVDATIPTTDTGGTVVLAERPDAGWRAWLDGNQLRAVTHGWQQAFEVPAGAGGELVVRYSTPVHLPWQVAIGAIVVVVTLIAIPVRRRRLDMAESEE